MTLLNGARAALVVFLSCAAIAPASAGPLKRKPYVQLTTPNSSVVLWRTKAITDGWVRYGLQPNQLMTQVADGAVAKEHAVKLEGLTPATDYYYAVGTGDQVLKGGDENHRFRTAPLVGSAGPTRVWVLGDSGTGKLGARNVRDAFFAFSGPRRADLWLMLGDNAYDTGTLAEYQLAVFKLFGAMLRQRSLWPALGNHDVESSNAGDQSGPFFNLFQLPKGGQVGGAPSGTEAYYSFDWGNAHFICLDSATDPAALGDDMITWLDQDLVATQEDDPSWVIAYWHHSPYSKGSHDSDEDQWMSAMRTIVVPRLEAAGVDLVLTAHSHGYERTALIDGHYGKSITFAPSMVVHGGDGAVGGGGAYPKESLGVTPHEGAVYVVLGCSANLKGGGDFDHPAMVVNKQKLGSLVLDIHDRQLDGRFLDDKAKVRDHFTILKGGGTAQGLVRPLIDAGSKWRYSDHGALVGAGWRQLAFDDTAWPKASGALGYGSPLVVSTVKFGGDPNDRHITTYFRRAFSLPFDPAQVESLRLRVRADDGFVAYLNGVEVARVGFPAEAPVEFHTLSAPHSAKPEMLIELGVGKDALVLGQNVLAVELHQASPSSGDLVFDASLEADAFAGP